MVDAIILEDRIGKHVDTLLERCSCPDARLIGLFPAGQENRTRSILKQDNTSLGSLEAHCRSFEELQALARILQQVSSS